jgi:hypothetical protein
VRHEHESPTTREPPERPHAQPEVPAVTRVLELQRSAGNAAVARRLARDVTPDVITGAGANYTVAGALAKPDYKTAWMLLNGLSMTDMLNQISTLGSRIDDLFTHTADATGLDLPRMQWAHDIVKDRKIGGKSPDAAQFEEAVRFLVTKPAADAEKVFGVALASIGGDAAHKPTAKFRERLKAGEAKAREIVARAGEVVPEKMADWGVDKITSGGGGRHAKGVAIDINFDSCPYVIGEAGEGGLDKAAQGANFDSLADTYDRIAWVMGGARSAINTVISPHGAKTDTRKSSDTSTQAGADYDKLKADSEAMQRYFALVGEPDATLDATVKAIPAGAPAATKLSALKTADDLRKRIAFDYLAVGGARANLDALAAGERTKLPGYGLPAAAPTVKSTTEKKPDGTAKDADRPFAGGDSTRAPEKGYMNIRKEIVMGLTGVGMRWGATDFGPGASGDIMHFDCDDCM